MNDGVRELARWAFDTAPAPCELGCPHQERCKTRKEACDIFLKYCGIKRKNVRSIAYEPSRECYLRVFPRDRAEDHDDLLSLSVLS